MGPESVPAALMVLEKHLAWVLDEQMDLEVDSAEDTVREYTEPGLDRVQLPDH